TTTGAAADDSKLDLPGVITLPQAGNSASAAIWAFARGESGDLILNTKNTVFASISPLASGSSARFEVIKMWVNGLSFDKLQAIATFGEGTVFANLDGDLAQITDGGFVNFKGTEE